MAETTIVVALVGIIAILVAARKSMQLNSNQQDTPTPLPPAENYLNMLALGIQKHEGWTLIPPSRSVRNHSPGNVKYSPVGYLPMYEPVGKDPENFAIFKDYATGFLYLKNLILEKAMKDPTANLFDFFSVYAPRTDGNDPVAYAEAVGEYMNVNPTLFRMNLVIT